MARIIDRILACLFPWWPLQALLHTRRIIFSGPMFLLCAEVRGVMAPCMKDGDLLLSGPYFMLLWFRFAKRLPGKTQTGTKDKNLAATWVDVPEKESLSPRFVRRFSSLKVSGVSKAKMESLS